MLLFCLVIIGIKYIQTYIYLAVAHNLFNINAYYYHYQMIKIFYDASIIFFYLFFSLMNKKFKRNTFLYAFNN